jgi:Skp family chaperone for outer membrane proteins
MARFVLPWKQNQKKAGRWCPAKIVLRRSIMKLLSVIALALFTTSAFANQTAAPAAANTEVTAATATATTTATTETKVEKKENNVKGKKIKAKKAKKANL